MPRQGALLLKVMDTSGVGRREQMSWRPTLVGLAVTTPIGLSRLCTALGGDQSLFLYGAAALNNGAALYVDFWDNKQPGIYWFYLAAGRSFGFTETGLHLFELVWLLSAAALLSRTVQLHLRTPWLAAFVPLTTVGAYYAAAGTWHLTQVEILLTLPMALCLWATFRDSGSARARRGSAAVLGAATALTADFKLVAVTLPLLFAVAHGVRCRADGARIPELVRQLLLPGAAAFAVVVVASLVPFYLRSSFDALAWTTFVYPGLALREVTLAGPNRLLDGLAWLTRGSGPLYPLAAIGVLVPSSTGASRFPAVMLAGWMAAGATTILLQRFSWWEYHFSLLLVPIGLLAVLGVDRVLESLTCKGMAPRTRPLVVAAVIGLVVIPIAAAAVRRGLRLGLAVIQASSQGTSVPYVLEEGERRIVDSVRAVPGLKGGGRPIYVFGDPGLLRHSGRRQALAVHGWAWEMMLSSQWTELPLALESARPEFVYVSPYYADLLGQRSPEVLAWLARFYAVVHVDVIAGTWYQEQSPRISCQ